jgi:hypothetical protein
VNRAIRERGRERLVHEPVLLEQRQAVEAPARDRDLEMIAAARPVLDRELRRFGKCLAQQRFEPLACHRFDASRAGNHCTMRAVVVAIAYTGLTLVAGLYLLLAGALGCYEECRYDVPNPPWPYDVDAWQWDAIFWSGVAGFGASLAFAAAVGRSRSRVAASAFALQMTALAVGAGFVVAAGDLEVSPVVLVLGGLLAAGSVLFALRVRSASSHAGARGTRADPTA